MPIEFCFVPKDNPEIEYEPGLVEPGSGLSIENYISGEAEKVLIVCHKQDTMGAALIFTAQESEDLYLGGSIELDDLPEPLNAVAIEKNSEPKDIPYSDGDGAEGFLRLRYVGSHAVTASGLVPRGLINQN